MQNASGACNQAAGCTQQQTKKKIGGGRALALHHGSPTKMQSPAAAPSSANVAAIDIYRSACFCRNVNENSAPHSTFIISYLSSFFIASQPPP
jgi:hypothetical protein